MEIIKIFLVFLSVCGASIANEDNGFVVIEDVNILKKNVVPASEPEQPLSLKARIDRLENCIARQDIIIEKLTKENQQKTTQIELLQHTLGAMGNKPILYQKMIPADVVFWVALGWSFLATYQIYDGNFITSLTVFFTTGVSIYWALKKVRNIAGVVTNRN